MNAKRINGLSVILFLLAFAATCIYLTFIIVKVSSMDAAVAPAGHGRYVDESIEPLPFVPFAQWRPGQYSTVELLLQLYIPGISLIIFGVFSAFLYARRKHDPGAIMLILFFLSMGIGYYSSAASQRSDPVGLSIIYVVLPLIPLLFMAFMNIYLQRFNVSFIDRKWLCLFSVLIGTVGCLSLLYIWSDLLPPQMLGVLKTSYSIVLLGGNLFCAIALVRKYWKHRKTKLSTLFTITFVSHLIALVPFTVFNLLPQWFGRPQMLPALFAALFLFVLPIVYFYLSTSSQLFDIDFILTRFKYYTALSLAPSIVVASLIPLALLGGPETYWSKWLGAFMVVFFGMILFLYGKEYIDHRLRPKWFKAMYSYQDSLDRFSRNIGRVMKQSDLEEVLLQEIKALLPVSRISFLVVDQTERTVAPEGDSQEEKVTSDFLLSTAASCQLGDLVDLPYGLGLVLGKQRTRYHVLWIGSKTNHTRFNSDEIRWLKTMANYASIVYENLYLIESLVEDLQSEVRKEHSTSPWALRLLFCLSENERRKLAADLHDSALQEQLLWYRKLESILMDHSLSDKLGQELEEIKEGLLDVIHQIRETCNELRPPLLKEMGVVEAVESIIEHTQMRVNFEVKFRAGAFQQSIDEEQITAIYRIVQELLRNADKHAGAKLVVLELELRQNDIYFHYRDDGIGMDMHSMEESFEHMGLSGIKERVASLEGSISFISERGNGLEVTIRMPVILSNMRNEREFNHGSYLIS